MPPGSSRTVLGTRHALMRAASVTVPIFASNVLIYYISVYIILSYLFSIQFHFLSYIRHPTTAPGVRHAPSCCTQLADNDARPRARVAQDPNIAENNLKNKDTVILE